MNNDKLKILYVSCLCSKYTIEKIFSNAVNKPALSIQKFHRLLVEGFAKEKDLCQVQVLSSAPVTTKSHKKRFWKLPSEIVDNIEYSYAPFINIPILKNICVFSYSFLEIFFSNLFFGRKNKVVVCDILNISVSAAALIACKLSRTKAVAIVTDMPGLLVASSQNPAIKNKIANSLASYFMKKYDGYILLTEQMNQKVNIHKKPYVIMEGLVDCDMVDSENLLENKAQEKIIIYAGGIYEKYGIKKLIEAFMKIDDPCARLHIYGHGDMAQNMQIYTQQDLRIVYHGVVPNKTVVESELKATLLVNPRPSSEELTKYSFPSKNMEYMVSGTPIVTTPLPGMPKEYNDYVYLIEDESIEGIQKTLKEILSKPKEQLHDFGMRAKQFVLTNKSNTIQAKRFLSFFYKLLE